MATYKVSYKQKNGVVRTMSVQANSVAEAKAKFQASYPGQGYKFVSAYKAS